MRKYLIAGLLVWLPLAVTVWVLLWVMGLLNSVFVALVKALQTIAPPLVEPLNQVLAIPGIGAAVLLLALMLTGMFVTNVVGQWWLRQWDRLLSNTPIVKGIYNSVKQVSDTLFSSSGNAFREAVLVPYPHAHSWTIAFVTGKPSGEVSQWLPGEHVSLYVPTTPNPTSGFFLMMPRSHIRALNMSVDEALKYIISMGVVTPPASALALPASAGEADPNRLG